MDSCCKRIGGACRHDVNEAQKRYDLKVQQLKYDLNRPGIQSYERDRIQEELRSLANPSESEFCPKCCNPLRADETHRSVYDGAYGEQVEYTCNKYK